MYVQYPAVQRQTVMYVQYPAVQRQTVIFVQHPAVQVGRGQHEVPGLRHQPIQRQDQNQ